MMLVMTTTGVFDGCHSNLIDATWSKLNEFVPQLRAELNPSVPSLSSSEEQLDPKVDRHSSAEEVAATEQKASNNGEVTILSVGILLFCRCLVKCCYSSTTTLSQPST